VLEVGTTSACLLATNWEPNCARFSLFAALWRQEGRTAGRQRSSLGATTSPDTSASGPGQGAAPNVRPR